jgi:uncharacterized protein
MDSISDKLRSLGVKVGTKEFNLSKPNDDYPIDKVVSGGFQSTIFGDVFSVKASYPSDYKHGNGTLLVNDSLKIMAEWGQVNRLAQSDQNNFIFLDTETSGLAGGTGTFAFLIGLGRFKDNEFQLFQYFLRDPSEERALLTAINEFFLPDQAIVTFNGKSFDIPLLNTRYTLQAITSPFNHILHLDLLPLARRLWRDRLPSRALGYLEANVLGAFRTMDEVPGWLIPQYYFDYLRSGDARPLQGVFYHNAMDILSLAALFSHTNSLLADPLAVVDQPGLDLVALGRLFEELGYVDISIKLFERGLDTGLPDEFLWQTVERFAALYKKERDWESAIRLWHRAAEHGDLYAFIELAKYHEHIVKDPLEAARWTQSAINHLISGNFPRYLQKQLLQDYDHRLKRLQGKDN